MAKGKERTRMRELRAEGPTAKLPQRHLYLVLDDWACGYAIRKIDLTSDDSDRQWLSPPIFCFEAQRGLPMYFVAAFGSKIIAMHPRNGLHDDNYRPTHPLVPRDFVPVFDVGTRTFSFCPRPEIDRGGRPLYISIGDDKLFAMCGALQVLDQPPPDDIVGQWCDQSWSTLPYPPFDSVFFTSYATHPDGRSFFVSVGNLTAPANYSFHVDVGKRMGWRAVHGWVLPFNGQAHFGPKLDASVGLSRYPDAVGHVCACNLASASSSTASDGKFPGRKVSKEKLFSEDPAERHVGATLVYMGGESEFCLVQCIWTEYKHVAQRIHKRLKKQRIRFSLEGTGSLQSWCYLFRLTTFSLKYDENGDLTTGTSRRVRYYRVPDGTTQFMLKFPVAFWM